MPGIRSYNAFLKSAKSQQGLTHKQAQSLYRRLRDREGKAPTRLYLRQHPRISKQEVQKTLREPQAPKRGRAPAVAAPPSRVILNRPRKPIRFIGEYLDLSDEPFDVEIIGAGVDTGKAKK